jgi:hypothetical protein
MLAARLPWPRSNLARSIDKDETGQMEAIRCPRNIGRLSTVSYTRG